MSVEDDEAIRGADGRRARQRRRRWERNAARGPGEGYDDFAPLVGLLQDLAASVDPAEQRKLTRAIAADLRNANARRIRANVQPDGSPMVPRKPQASGGIRARRLRDRDASQFTRLKIRRSEKVEAMFRRATAPQYLRQFSSVGEAQVGFVGAMARIMRVHQFGLRDHVTRDAGSPEVTYPARQVIGLTQADRVRVLDKVAAQVGV